MTETTLLKQELEDTDPSAKHSLFNYLKIRAVALS